MGMRGALIHRGHVRRQVLAGTPDVLGEVGSAVVDGPEFRCRLLVPRGGGSEARDAETGSSRVREQYELLVDFTAADGTPVVLEPDMEVFVVAPVVTGPAGWLLTIDGHPENLNTGRQPIGWDARAVRSERGA